MGSLEYIASSGELLIDERTLIFSDVANTWNWNFDFVEIVIRSSGEKMGKQSAQKEGTLYNKQESKKWRLIPADRTVKNPAPANDSADSSLGDVRVDGRKDG